MRLSREETKIWVTCILGKEPSYICPCLDIEVDMFISGELNEHIICSNGNAINTLKDSNCNLVDFVGVCDKICYY